MEVSSVVFRLWLFVMCVVLSEQSASNQFELISDAMVSWSDGRDRCGLESMDLAVLTTDESVCLGKAVVKAFGSTTNTYWVGIYINSTAQYWLDGADASGANWGNGEPDASFPACGHYEAHTRLKFEDDPCSDTMYILCGIQGTPVSGLNLPESIQVNNTATVGETVFTVNATDPYVSTKAPNYNITAITPTGDFDIDLTTGIVTTNAVLTAGTVYEITIETMYSCSITETAILTVTVIDPTVTTTATPTTTTSSSPTKTTSAIVVGLLVCGLTKWLHGRQ